MPISTAPQLRQTYQLWRRFDMPVEGGVRDAIAVPTWVANQLNSAYTIMMTSMVMNLWVILFAIGFYFTIRREKHHHISTTLWNKRTSLTDSLLELVLPSDKGHWREWWVYPVILIIVTCWIAQNVLSIIIPPYIFVGNAAPVNPYAIFAPRSVPNNNSANARIFSLEVPSALRAAGAAQVASASVQSKASVSEAVLGTLPNGETIKRISYDYNITGADLGLQDYPTLLLTVSGACTTEYGWLLNSTNALGYTNDTYALFGNRTGRRISLSLFDGASPVAYFYPGSIVPEGPPGNKTWAAFVSAVDRVSFTPSGDPIYNTGNSSGPGLAGARQVVQPRRPALSCWQTDTWWYNGRSSTIVGLNSTALPGLELSDGMQLILAKYLGAPKVVDVGRQLGLSALLSSTTSLGSIFDAGSSSAFTDLHRLVLAAYIATTNTLTDLTLYPEDVQGKGTFEGNIARQEDGEPKPGVGAFVVFSTDITSLSIKAIIIIPVLSLVVCLLAIGLLRWSPLKSVTALDVEVIHRTLVNEYPDAKPHAHGRTWHYTRSEKTGIQAGRDTPDSGTAGAPKAVPSAGVKEISPA